MMTSSTRYSHS